MHASALRPLVALRWVKTQKVSEINPEHAILSVIQKYILNGLVDALF